MKTLGIIATIIVTLIAIVAISYLIIGIFTILKNGTSLTQTPGTIARLKVFLSNNSAETAKKAVFPELQTRQYAWPEDGFQSFVKLLSNTATTLNYELQELTPTTTLNQTFDTETLLHFTVTTKYFKFIDDVYVRIKRNSEIITVNVKSQSRTGRADFGANLANIRELFNQLEQTITPASP